MRILVCDDEQKLIDLELSILQEYCRSTNIAATFFTFTDSLSAGNIGEFDIAFLDIDMEKLNGIELARKLRSKNPTSIIIFVTNFIQYAPEGYEVNAFRYLYYKYWKSQKKLMGGSWQKSLDKKSSKYAPSLLALRGTDFVICNDHGFPINPDSYGALVRRIGQRAGIEGLHPHMFRHTFVSILLSNPEIGVATVAAEAGHAQPSTTLAIYTQVYDKRRKEIRNQMSKELYE